MCLSSMHKEKAKVLKTSRRVLVADVKTFAKPLGKALAARMLLSRSTGDAKIMISALRAASRKDLTVDIIMTLSFLSMARTSRRTEPSMHGGGRCDP